MILFNLEGVVDFSGGHTRLTLSLYVESGYDIKIPVNLHDS